MSLVRLTPHYFNGLRHINATWWTKLALSVVLFARDDIWEAVIF